MIKVPLCRALIEESEEQAVLDVLRSGWLTHGPKTEEFEQVFAKYVGVNHAVAMNSCTSALFMALIGNDIKGEVLVPSFTFAASANAIVTAGATPVFVDINVHDGNLNHDLLESYVTTRTEAIMPVHFAGQCCNMEIISAFAQKHSLAIIEDSAECVGGTFTGQSSGSWGTGCYSFFPTKNITTGEGGMFTTNDASLAARVRTLIAHGMEKSTLQRSTQQADWYRAAILPGYNFRLSNLLATIGVEQMKKVDHMNADRRRHSLQLIEDLSGLEKIALPRENPECHHVYQMFTLRLLEGDRAKFVRHLREKGVGASVHFYPPVHLHPAYAAHNNLDLTGTRILSESIITLPMFPHMTDEQRNHVARSVQEIHANI